MENQTTHNLFITQTSAHCQRKKKLQTNLPLHVLVIQICWFLWWSSPALSVWFLLSYTSHPEMNKNTQKWKIFRLLFCYKIFFNLSLVVWKVVSANLGLKVKLALDFSRNRVYFRAYILKVLPWEMTKQKEKVKTDKNVCNTTKLNKKLLATPFRTPTAFMLWKQR